MNYWDVMGWALAAIVVLFVLLVLVASVKAVIAPRKVPKRARDIIERAADKMYPESILAPENEALADAFVTGAEWAISGGKK